MSNVATIIGELLEDKKISLSKLLEISDQYPVASLQRTGYLIDTVREFVSERISTDRLQKRLAGSKTVLLFASRPRRGLIDQRWNVDVNGDVEPDL